MLQEKKKKKQMKYAWVTWPVYSRSMLRFPLATARFIQGKDKWRERKRKENNKVKIDEGKNAWKQEIL